MPSMSIIPGDPTAPVEGGEERGGRPGLDGAGQVLLRRWGPLFTHLRPPRVEVDVAADPDSPRRALAYMYYYPSQLGARMVLGFLLGIFVRCVPRCNRAAPAGASAAQLSLLLALSGSHIGALHWMRPVQVPQAHRFLCLAAWCDFLTFAAAAVLSFGVHGAGYAIIVIQLSGVCIQLGYIYFKLANRFSRRLHHRIRGIAAGTTSFRAVLREELDAFFAAMTAFMGEAQSCTAPKAASHTTEGGVDETKDVEGNAAESPQGPRARGQSGDQNRVIYNPLVELMGWACRAPTLPPLCLPLLSGV
ncbi:hypothetical protein CYMTET_33580 [Cymbomonas tetramitiformis]|uniref:Uncharacterized protein n=1 Tax=Cymbomonas tetramitiformis TaxID=36881 RepID=A0AAE0KR17_9CHLO|nr:hypothetical protein CYMTET_33580 [Cymbomonas tetramitiformis]